MRDVHRETADPHSRASRIKIRVEARVRRASTPERDLCLRLDSAAPSVCYREGKDQGVDGRAREYAAPPVTEDFLAGFPSGAILGPHPVTLRGAT